MRVRIVPIDIPIVWLDTSIYVKLAKLQAGERIPAQDAERLKELVSCLERGIAARRLICPEGDQFEEIEMGERLVGQGRRVQAVLSRGIRFLHRLDIEQYQLARGMDAYIFGQREVVLPTSEVITPSDVEQQLEEPWIVYGWREPDSEEIERRQMRRQRTLADVRCLRARLRAEGITFEQHLETELRDQKEAMLKVLGDVQSALETGTEPHLETIRKYATLVGIPLRIWKDKGGNPPTLEGLFRFMESDAYRSLPYLQIRAHLWADILTGGAEIEQGDVMDIEHLGAVLPYAAVVVTDRRMRNRIRRLGLDHRYNTTVFAMADIDELLRTLESL
ncbi:hypothetical protein Tmar_1911 [Thermaerobacter marianensis DSM 12885]|uniref:Uncharacterized protein n=1 Tax=Thermaerobacter marianensis (strain ATCC 700841 / DSM 12885 / JCM 10246 / 7p75a) TaxID=644966 RepID=E6SIQ3_THEM7|nr:hypothetical protein Tmar_1911 [Thermaerobacter marianensis DSM 12885]